MDVQAHGQCVLGYALAPILLASIVSMLVHNLFVRIPVSLACWAWSVWGERLLSSQRSYAANASFDELLHRHAASRLPDMAGGVPSVPVLLRPIVDDYDTMTRASIIPCISYSTDNYLLHRQLDLRFTLALYTFSIWPSRGGRKAIGSRVVAQQTT